MSKLPSQYATIDIDQAGPLRPPDGGSGSGNIVSINGHLGPFIVLDKTDIGLSNVDNTSDTGKPVSTAQQTALDLKADKSTTLAGYGIANAYTSAQTDSLLSAKQNTLGFTPEDVSKKGAANGYAPLGADSKVPSANLPADGTYKGTYNASTNTPTITAGVGNNGDFYIVSVAGTVSANSVGAVAAGDQIRFNATAWQKIPSSSAVQSVAGKTGVVTLTSTDVGLANVNNTSDANKPVSTAQQTALDAKLNLTGGTLSGVLIGPGFTMAGTNGTQVYDQTTSFVVRAHGDRLIVYNAAGTTAILDADNAATRPQFKSNDLALKSDSDAKVTKSGDTMTGNLVAPAFLLPNANGSEIYDQTSSMVVRAHGDRFIVYKQDASAVILDADSAQTRPLFRGSALALLSDISSSGLLTTDSIRAVHFPPALETVNLPAIRKRLRNTPDIFDYATSVKDATNYTADALIAAMTDFASSGHRELFIPISADYHIGQPLTLDRGYIFNGEDRSQTRIKIEHASGPAFWFTGQNGGGGGIKNCTIGVNYSGNPSAAIYLSSDGTASPDGASFSDLWITYFSTGRFVYCVSVDGHLRSNSDMLHLLGVRDTNWSRIQTFGATYAAFSFYQVHGVDMAQIFCNAGDQTYGARVIFQAATADDWNKNDGVTIAGMTCGQLTVNNTNALTGFMTPQGGLNIGSGITNSALLVPVAFHPATLPVNTALNLPKSA